MRYGYRRHSILAPILIIVIVLCIVAIGILTWALFRVGADDDGKIGTNVTSGKVKVDIINANGDSLIGDAFKFVTDGEEDSVIFAPGLMYYTEGFYVKNDGNLDIKYRVFISEDESIDNTAFQEAFDFYLVTDISQIGTLENAEKLNSYTGSLDKNKTSGVYYLVIRMKETAGNEFQDRTFSGIGITVHATQSNSTENP